MPRVQESQKKRFEKVVRYYFPGDVAKFVLGMNCEEVHLDINDRVQPFGNVMGGGSRLDDAVLQFIRSLGCECLFTISLP